MEQLSIKFLNELYKLTFYKTDVIEIVKEHLEFHFIPNELKEYKRILKDITNYHTNNNKLPSIGIISQMSNGDSKVQQILTDISNIKLPEKDDVLKQFEVFIKRAKFQELYAKVADIYNAEDRQDEAMNVLAKESEKIVSFTLKKNNYFENIFKGFEERQRRRDLQRLTDEQNHSRLPFGIYPLDDCTYGGTEETEIDLFIARSGTGKTTWLVWRAISAARRGYPVLHISAEGAKHLIEKKFDIAWTALSRRELEFDNINEDLRVKLEKTARDIVNKSGEISVVAFEQFGMASMVDVRNMIIDYIKINGYKPALVTIDYIEKFNPGDGRRYSVSTEGEKMRREAVAEKMKNIAVEFKIRIATATQSNDINPSDFNRSEFVITRHNVSSAKGLIDAFSYVFTWNQTNDEYGNNVGRIYVDKLRDHKGGQVLPVATQFNKSRFYDHKRSIKLYYEEE